MKLDHIGSNVSNRIKKKKRQKICFEWKRQNYKIDAFPGRFYFICHTNYEISIKFACGPISIITHINKKKMIRLIIHSQY